MLFPILWLGIRTVLSILWMQPGILLDFKLWKWIRWWLRASLHMSIRHRCSQCYFQIYFRCTHCLLAKTPFLLFVTFLTFVFGHNVWNMSFYIMLTRSFQILTTKSNLYFLLRPLLTPFIYSQIYFRCTHFLLAKTPFLLFLTFAFGHNVWNMFFCIMLIRSFVQCI